MVMRRGENWRRSLPERIELMAIESVNGARRIALRTPVAVLVSARATMTGTFTIPVMSTVPSRALAMSEDRYDAFRSRPRGRNVLWRPRTCTMRSRRATADVANSHGIRSASGLEVPPNARSPRQAVAPISPPDTSAMSVSYTHLRAHETVLDLVC